MSRSAGLCALCSTALLAAAVAGAVLLAHGDVVDLAMLGWDGWPMVASSRITGWGDLLGTFHEELMDGRYPYGRFYRPVANLAFALDHALWGLDPAGYHRTDLALLVVNGTLLGRLAARLVGGRAGAAAGWIAALAFVLHPVQLEVLPVPPRRADALCLAFVLATLSAQPHPDGRGRARTTRRRAGAIALLAAAAVAAKETGAVVAPLVVAWQLCFAREGAGVEARLAGALRRAAPALAGVAVLLAARAAVLGGLGGHVAPPGAEPVAVPRLWAQLVERVVHPQPLLGTGPLASAAVAAAALALVAAVVAASRSPAPQVRREVRPAAAFLGLWALCLFGVTSLADRMHDWYAMLFLAPTTIAVALLVPVGVAELTAGRRGRGAASIACAGLLLACFVASSSVVRSFPLLRDASAIVAEHEQRLERSVRRGEEGQVVRFNPWIPMLAPNPDGSDVRSLHLADAYTLQAWCDLHFPDRSIEVRRWRPGGLEPRPGTLVVELVPGPEPGWLHRPR